MGGGGVAHADARLLEPPHGLREGPGVELGQLELPRVEQDMYQVFGDVIAQERVIGHPLGRCLDLTLSQSQHVSETLESDDLVLGDDSTAGDHPDLVGGYVEAGHYQPPDSIASLHSSS